MCAKMTFNQGKILTVPVAPKPAFDAQDPELNQCIFDGLKRLWQSQALLDYTLVAEGRSFHVHRAVLASVSDYFYAMLTSGMKETQQDYVELKAIDACMLQLLLDYLYTGILHITEDNVIGLLNDAAHLQISTAIKACLSFIVANISVGNCVEMLDIVRLHSSDRDFTSKIEDFVAENLSLLIKSGDYLNLSFDSLKGLLCKEELMFGPEEKLYQAVMQWLKHKPEKRMKFHNCLMEDIRFPLMTTNQVNTIIKTHSELMCDPVLNKKFKQAKEYLSKPVYQRVLCQNSHTRLRMKPCLLVIEEETAGDEGWVALNTGKGKWHNVRKVDFQDTVQAGWIVVNDFLFICGGGVGDRAEPTKKFYVFDPREYKWTQLASISATLYNCSLLEHKGFLYMLGSKKIERYSFKTNKWELFTEMYSEWQRFFITACVVNDRIYTCDQVDEQHLSTGIPTTPNNMAFLDILTKTWQIAPMYQGQKRASTMWLEGDLLYSVEDFDCEKPPAITWYDPKTGDNGLVFSPERLLNHAEIVTDNGKVYFICGALDSDVPGPLSPYTSCLEVTIRDKSVLVITHIDPYPNAKKDTRFCVQLRLPWHEFILNEEK